MTRFQTAIVVLLGFILGAIALPEGLTYYQRWQDYQKLHQMFLPSTTGLTPAQRELVLNGYFRDNATHRWYPWWSKEIAAHGCQVSGTSTDATFNCRVPLTDGIPDPIKE